MLIQLLIGAGLLAVCVIIHVTVLDIVAIRLRSIIAAYDFPLPQGLRLTILVGASLSVFLSHIVQVCMPSSRPPCSGTTLILLKSPSAVCARAKRRAACRPATSTS